MVMDGGLIEVVLDASLAAIKVEMQRPERLTLCYAKLDLLRSIAEGLDASGVAEKISQEFAAALPVGARIKVVHGSFHGFSGTVVGPVNRYGSVEALLDIYGKDARLRVSADELRVEQ